MNIWVLPSLPSSCSSQLVDQETMIKWEIFLRCLFFLEVSSSMCDIRFVFQHLPEPNRAYLVGVYAVTLDPLLSFME